MGVVRVTLRITPKLIPPKPLVRQHGGCAVNLCGLCMSLPDLPKLSKVPPVAGSQLPAPATEAVTVIVASQSLSAVQLALLAQGGGILCHNYEYAYMKKPKGLAARLHAEFLTSVWAQNTWHKTWSHRCCE